MLFYNRLDSWLEAQADNAGPIRGTLSMLRIGMIWLAANLVITTLLTGTLFIPGVDYATAITMIVLGTLAGAIVLITVGNIGTRTGLPTMALTRGAFGIRGSYLPVVVNVLILMGWSWVQAMLAGVTVNYVVTDLTGFSNPILFSVLCQTLVVALTIFGHEGIAKVEPLLAVTMLAIIVWIFIVVFTTFTPAQLQTIPVNEAIGYSPTFVLDIVIATAISWTVLSADFNRFAKSSRAGILGSGIGYTLSTVISMALGLSAFAYTMLTSSHPIPFDPSVLVAKFGAPFAIVSFLSVMATNTMVVYGMATSVVNAKHGGRPRFLPIVLVLGVISIIGSTWLGLLEQFTKFLVLISALFAPVFAIMIVDFYFIKRSTYTADLLRTRGGRYWYTGGINWAAIFVWVVGAVATYVWTKVWLLPIGATISAFALCFVLYFLLMLPDRARYPKAPSP